jgi:glycerol uptake facilitator-like aquaporin
VTAGVGRRLLAEFTGSGLLVAIVVGSGIAAARLTTDGALRLLVNSLVTAMGLAVLIVVLARTGRLQHVAWAAGAWIGAAYWFTASTSFANPAVTIGRSLTNTYARIAPASVPAFIAAQLVGGAIGTVLAMTLYPVRRGRVQVEEPARLAG